MKYLITGFSGFVSYHFLRLLNEKEPGSEVMGLSRNTPEFNTTQFKEIKINFKSVDLLDREAISGIIKSYQPERILHLASVSSVAKSWLDPLNSFVNNTNIFLNLAEEIRIQKIPCRILSIGSSEEFGEVSVDKLPLTEEHPLHPVSPYAVARVSQEMLSNVYAEGFGLDIIMTRSFNHLGPGQKATFAISSFAKQLVEMSLDPLKARIIQVGNLSITRDFVDVRDVVKAYLLLFQKGRSGEIYNICSEKGVLLENILHLMSEQLGISVHTKVDTNRIRPNENKKIIGSFKKINEELGWSPVITIEDSLRDILAYWKKQLTQLP
jgi:GDP-4-dehydro-6-deoxy-D-mannose reductase